MAINTAVCTSFKKELLEGIHGNDDVYKIALYTNMANIGGSTTSYTNLNEASGEGYNSGGQILQGRTIIIDGESVILDWTTDPGWPDSTITAAGALIYNASKANRSVCSISFGSDKTSINGLFRVVLPPPTYASGLVVLT